MRAPNILSGLLLDRAAHLRVDDDAIEAMWRGADTRVVPVWRSQHFLVRDVRPEVVFVPSDRVARHRRDRILLGTSHGTTFFAVDLSHVEDPAAALALDLDSVHSVLGLREAAALLPRAEGALLSYANSMTSWHTRHRYCGLCGHETRATTGGHVRACSNGACGGLHFPRTDPAVITLVTDGERCLLGRQAAWPVGVYSTIAGFVEPGESLEEAVAREVLEETGIQIGDIRYHSSQPWPFPGSVMLGFVARARTVEVTCHDQELEDARWFSREEVRGEKGMKLPSKISIARRLVEDWLAQDGA